MDVSHANDNGHKLTRAGSETIKIDVGPCPSSLASSPAFGSAFPLYQSKGFSAYCVACGASGTVNLAGSIGWTSGHPNNLQSGSINIGGNLGMGLGIGISGSTRFDSPSLHKQLIQQSLPGLSIPSIITIGPQLVLDVSLGSSITAAGSLFAGFSIVIPILKRTLISSLGLLRALASHQSFDQYSKQRGPLAQLL